MSAATLAERFIERTRYYLGVEYPAKIRAALLAMPADRVWWRPNEHSNSAGNLVLHLCGNVRQWIVSGVGGQADARLRDLEFATRDGVPLAELLAHLERTLSEVDAVLAALPPGDLDASREIQGRTTSVFSAIYHVVEHFSTHTGQIVWIAKMWSGEGGVRFYDDANNAAPLFLEGGRSDIEG
jgi:uncharacterized damage-inducible protein DinB